MTGDIEERLRRVWNPDVRPLVEEAWRSYGVGAYRACIALTWVAVCEDLTTKVLRLAETGDSAAVAAVPAIESAREGGLDAVGVRAMQTLERGVIDTALDLELVDAIAARELQRLREDRHLCVHPSLGGDVYYPRAETAKAHLAAALENLLTLPPRQGRTIVDRFASHVRDPLFTVTDLHLLHSYFDAARDGARRGIIDLAAKHAMLELTVPGAEDDRVVADRMAACLIVFAGRDREAVRAGLSKSLDRMRDVSGDVLMRALSRLGPLDVMWDVADVPLVQRFVDVIELMPGPDHYGVLAPHVIEVLSLVAVGEARGRLPTLVGKFEALSERAKASVIARRPSPFFAPYIGDLLRGAGGWRTAEEITRNAVLPMAHVLSTDQVGTVLMAWATNEQCRTAGGMRELACDLYGATSHLHPTDAGVWSTFLSEVRSREPVSSFYRYTELDALLSPLA